MTIKLYWPVEDLKRGFNQAYGANPDIYRQWGLPGHEGIDFWAPSGSKIFSCADGVVKVVNAPGLVGYNATHNYGIHIRIAHDDGYETVYAHFERATVSVGDEVKASQIVGIADSTGNSTGSHLHLTLKKNGVIIDPTPYLVREFYSWQTEPEPEVWGCTAVVLAENSLNVRSKPGKEGVILGTLKFNARIQATHEFTNAQGEKWIRVEFDKHPDAWVINAWVRLENCTGDFPTWGTTDPPIQIPPAETPTHPPAEPAPTPGAEVIARMVPVLKRMRTTIVVLEDDIREALEIAGITLE